MAKNVEELKRIMPNQCVRCTIGIGRTMINEDGEWRQHEHIEQKVHIRSRKGTKYKICGWCDDKVRSGQPLVINK